MIRDYIYLSFNWKIMIAPLIVELLTQTMLEYLLFVPSVANIWLKMRYI
jgi:hypothetical protein